MVLTWSCDRSMTKINDEDQTRQPLKQNRSESKEAVAPVVVVVVVVVVVGCEVN